MKINFDSLFKKILYPPTWAKVLTFIVTVITAVGALLILLIDYQTGFLSIVSYSLFGVAGLSLAYSVYLIIPLIPKMRKNFITLMEKNEFTYLILRNFGFRTLIFAIGSFTMSVLFSAFNAFTAI